MDGERDEVTWDLIGPGGETRAIHHRPRLICTSFDVPRAAALSGVAHLPEHAARASIASRRLVHLLPEWHSAFGIIHAVFSTRKSLVPAVQAGANSDVKVSLRPFTADRVLAVLVVGGQAVARQIVPTDT